MRSGCFFVCGSISEKVLVLVTISLPSSSPSLLFLIVQSFFFFSSIKSSKEIILLLCIPITTFIVSIVVPHCSILPHKKEVGIGKGWQWRLCLHLLLLYLRARRLHQPMMSYLRNRAFSFQRASRSYFIMLSHGFQDLKNLRSQLYSAAEYFELSYTNDDHKQIVVNTLKDYAVKALVNTVDHLGSVSYKVNNLLNENVDEVSGSEIRVSCIEQRIRTCQDYIDHQGLSQQTLVITTPKYHKRYILPVGESMPESGRQAAAVCQEMDLIEENYESEQFQAAVRSTIRCKAPSVSKKMRSLTPSPRARSSSPSHRKVNYSSPSHHNGNLLSTEKQRSVSPLPTSNFFARSGSLTSRATVHNSSNMRRYPSEPQKSASMRLHAERNNSREFEQKSSKSRGFLKSLLSRRKSRNDEMLYSYLDEY
ncbi:hypothetical protein J5N97_019710 [Dioscorea zingiberensis]|uniref:Uncharacterized protein n=1 Tax=Dioscorea zingiberensis TaxID=325984 RepID=A0A9D5CED6_9LILI|nr:hypothetical protein J5N97_019710 [Dioscorea zingiberensis]